MSQLGIGVMLQALCYDADTPAALEMLKGREITSLKVSDECLEIQVEPCHKVVIWDGGQSCCESRYMTCDDKVEDFIGAQFIDAEVRDADDVPTEYDVHEVQFLIINTSLGAFTVATHNEHNGYYGGFALKAKIVETEC